MKKYFDILELNESASIEDLERAYKELSNAWRPENFQNLPRYRRKAELKLREVNEAYERLKSFLPAKPYLAEHEHPPETEAAFDQIEPDLNQQQADPEHGSFAERSFESEPPPAQKHPAETPPWEPDYPTKEPDVIRRPHIQKTVQKSLVFGFVAIIAILGVLLLYRVLDRQSSPDPRTAVMKETSEAAVKLSVTTPPEKVPRTQPEKMAKPETTAQTPKQSPAKGLLAKAESRIQQQAPPAAATAPEKINYQEILSEENLSRYNLNPARVKRVQKALIANGYDTGPVDGIIGPFTSA
ncbi:MAG: DnaJ domain-containing protein, partial [Desulfobacterales bacterium]|nr:DnaJ domain-containing protein [Desulfobacterales bacterium]